MQTARKLQSRSRNFDLLHRDVEERLAEHVRCRRNVPGSTVTTFGIGGLLPLVVEPRDIDSLAEVVSFLEARGEPFQVLGGGSNLLIRDDPFGDVVLHFGKEVGGFTFSEEPNVDLLQVWKRSHIEPPVPDSEGEIFLYAFAGAPLMGLSRRTAQWGIEGLEFGAGIPASVGGAVRMNAGAHGSMVSDVVHSVDLLRRSGEICRVAKEDLHFSYRHADLPEGAVVIGAMFSLRREDTATVLRRRNACLEYRKRTQPLPYPSAGSVFRNPILTPNAVDRLGEREVSAARLIEDCGLKGQRRGGVGFSTLHANWIVRYEDGAHAADVEALIGVGEEEVRGRFGVELDREIVTW